MRSAIFIALCLAVATVSAYTTEDGVIVLTDSNFAEALQEFDYALVEFYAPWCGHCKTLAPNYAAAAQQLAKTNPEIKLCKVDATVEKEVAGKFEIRGFPTLKFFTKGSSTPVAYEGGRTTPEIVNWLKKKAGPASVEVTSVETAEKLIGDNEVLAFFFGPAGEAFTNYLSAANSFDDVAFAHSNDQSVKDKFEVTGENTLVLFKKFDEGKNVHTGPFEQHNVRDFLNANRFPTILPFDQKAAQKIFGEGLEALFLITDNSEASAKAEEAFRAASSDLKGKIVLSLAKMGEGLADRLADYIGVSKDSLPAVRVVQAGQNMQKYPLESEITADNLKTFVDDFKNGKLKPYFKSEPIPENPLDDGVRVVVGKNFEEVVLDENTDVLMEYYAPWCGHCKSLAPIYSSLAHKLKDVSGVVIAKMDATANEVEGLNIQGFPTIKFYPRGNKQSPQDYNGERTEEGFIDYLRKNSKANIPQPKPEDIEL